MKYGKYYNPPMLEGFYTLPMTANSPVRLISRLIYRVDSIPAYKRLFWKFWYPRVTRGLGNDDVPFINWAYEENPPMAIPLAASDEPHRTHIQLYHRVATQAELAGKEVLEVSCGHGGGASYIMRTLKPTAYMGLDLNMAGIDFCHKRHNLPGLNFMQGDAESLPFGDGTYDVVLNVEASHCYPRFNKFLQEVVRVLRPGGYFLYADMRPRMYVQQWEAELAATPLQLLSSSTINSEVLRGMEMRSDTANDLINRHMPSFLHFYGREFAGVPGSRLHSELQRGDMSYRMYCFEKS